MSEELKRLEPMTREINNSRKTPSVLFSGVAAMAFALTVSVAGPVSAQDGIGGFEVYKQTDRYSSGQGTKRRKERPDEVIVSQRSGAKVRTIAQAMALVKPNGRILIEGGPSPYFENIDVTKSVEIRGIQDAYGREAVIRPASSAPCVSIAPDTPLAAVTVTHLEFEVDSAVLGEPCIDVRGGTVKIVENLISPVDANISRRAAFRAPGTTPQAYYWQLLGAPPRDRGQDESRYGEIEDLYTRHGVQVGAGVVGDTAYSGPVAAERVIHASDNSVGGNRLRGPSAGIRVTAGNASVHQNIIIGARKGIEFASINGADISGDVTMNHLAANGEGIVASGDHDVDTNLVLSRNTLKFNTGAAVKIDVTDGVQVLANEIIGNASGILLSENVFRGTVNSNMVYSNRGHAMLVSSNFSGVVSGNTFAENTGCTVQFFSAEQRFYDRDVKLIAGEDFEPRFLYAATNNAVENEEDQGARKKKRRRRKNRDKNIEQANMPPVCNGAL